MKIGKVPDNKSDKRSNPVKQIETSEARRIIL
jgi:hypothetical protein